ncbi:MAG: hypothetical protein JXQ90_13800 [Cyclobacteriaceae bacterium]
MKLFVTATLIVISTQLLAQSDFREGYVILNNNDTIHGFIDYRGDLMMARLCRFKSNEESVTNYLPGQIQAYRFIGSKFYVSKLLDNEFIFLEYLVDGRIDIFYIRQSEKDVYYIEKDGFDLTELKVTPILKINGIHYEQEFQRHKEILKSFTKDADELSSQIQNIKIPSHSNLIKLSKSYNQLICPDEACLVFIKQKSTKTKFLSLDLNLASGIVRSQSQEEANMSVFSTGLLLKFSLPRLNEKMYLRTGGMVIANQEFINLKVPVHLEYQFPKGKLRPQLSYGVNVFVPSTVLTNSVKYGVAVPVGDKSKTLGFMIEHEFFTESLFFPKEYFGTYVNLFISL